MADQTISKADIESLAQKLGAFNQTLTPGEQAALAAVVMRGTPQGEDVSGYQLRRNIGDPDTGDQGDPFDPIGQALHIPQPKTH
jgi:hypothetical protein